MPGVGVADEALARVVGRDPALRGRAVGRVVVADQAEPVLEPLGEALVQHRAVEDVLRRVADRGGAQPLVELATYSSWTDSWTIAVPSDVQRWPAVP